MARRYRFRGELSDLDVSAVAVSNPTLRGYVDRLAVLEVNGQPLGRDRARPIVERLLIGALDRVGGEYAGRFDAQMERVGSLRGQLKTRYDSVLNLFRKGAPPVHTLPPELQPQSIAALFDELDRALDDLEAQTSRHGLEDAMDHADRTRAAEDLLLDVEERRAGDVEPPSPRPDLDLDAPGEEFRWRARGEHDRAALAAYRERMRALPEDKRRRAEVRVDAVEWVETALPGAEVTLFRVPDYSEGNLAALARFRELDPRFSGRGYELQIALPDGPTFRPDGIRFVDRDGRRYQFLESKEPYTWTENAFYASEAGQAQLIAMLQRDAAIAQSLRGKGCVGFRYDTGHPELDRVLAEAIADMRANGWPGADLLSPPLGGD